MRRFLILVGGVVMSMGEGFNVHPNDDGYAVIAKAHRNAGN